MLQDQPEERGQRLFARVCTECHSVNGAGGAKAPRLDGYLSRTFLRAVLLHPDAPDLYGAAKISGMDSYGNLGEARVAGLVDFLYALRSHAASDPALADGQRIFLAAGCADCHALVPGESAGGPTLAGYGSDRWLRGLIEDAGAPAYYDVQNRMPDFARRLAPGQIDDLIAFLQSLASDEEPPAAH